MNFRKFLKSASNDKSARGRIRDWCDKFQKFIVEVEIKRKSMLTL